MMPPPGLLDGIMSFLQHVGLVDSDSDELPNDEDFAERPLVSSLRQLGAQHKATSQQLNRFLNSLIAAWDDLGQTMQEPTNSIDPCTLRFSRAENSRNRRLLEFVKLLRDEARSSAERADQMIDYLTPPTLEDFRAKYAAYFGRLPVEELAEAPESGGDAQLCTICFTLPVAVRIVRQCSPVDNDAPAGPHCEGHVCACPPSLCFDCLVQHYWTQTKHENMNYGCCPTCRAQFCIRDLVRLVPRRSALPPKKRHVAAVDESEPPHGKRQCMAE